MGMYFPIARVGSEYQENTKNTMFLLYLSAIAFGGGHCVFYPSMPHRDACGGGSGFKVFFFEVGEYLLRVAR